MIMIDWHSGYDVTIKAKIYKLGVGFDSKSSDLEEYILQYMNHVYQTDSIYATVTGLSPTSMSLNFGGRTPSLVSSN